LTSRRTGATERLNRKPTKSAAAKPAHPTLLSGNPDRTKMEQATATSESDAIDAKRPTRRLDTKSFMEASLPAKRTALVSCQEKRIASTALRKADYSIARIHLSPR
jgi:hypothetical protein